jgi:phosphatidylserine/phosphatidylglycerophosphate/cardiolipin synthase-like enzyme
LKLQRRIKEILEEKRKKGIEIIFVCRKNELKQNLSRYSTSIVDAPTLHAKCYLSEKGAILTSLNLYEFSQQNNDEMGIYVENKNDGELLYQDILTEVERLSKSKVFSPKPLNLNVQNNKNTGKYSESHKILSVQIVNGNALKPNWQSPMQVIITNKGEFIDNMPGNNFQSKTNAFPGYDWQQKVGHTVSGIRTINSMGFKWLNKKSD